MPEKFELEATIAQVKQVADKTYVIWLNDCHSIANIAQPGQFVMVWPNPDSYEHLLGRPFSIVLTQISEPRIGILVKVKGEGTKVLCRKKLGEKVRVLGPLGNGFDIIKTAPCEQILLVAGGTGVAGLTNLLKTLTSKVHFLNKEFHFFIGAETANKLVWSEKWTELATTYVVTDDGSAGRPGMVTDLLQDILHTYRSVWHPYLFAAGPIEMLREVTEIAKIHDIPAQVAVEAGMACGVGACLGCAVNVKDPTDPEDWTYKHVCKDGPIFDAQEVIWNE